MDGTFLTKAFIYIYILFLQGNSFNPENPDLNKNLLLFMREINPQNFHHFPHRL